MSTLQHLPRWAEDILRAVPVAGQGVHNWLFRAALVLFRCGREESVRTTVETLVTGCGRRVSVREMDEAIHNARGAARQTAGQRTGKTETRWPKPNLEQIEAVVANRGGLVDLWEASPVRFDDATEPVTETVFDRFFPGNPWLCCGPSVTEMEARRREDWRGKLAGLSFIVPNPMTAATGRNQAGEETKRCLENTGPRRFLVIECDFAEYARDGMAETDFAPLVRRWREEGKTPADAGAAVLMQLGEIAPLALAVHSAGKSVHGWFFCEGIGESTLLTFMRCAVVLGADRATWTRCQAVRIPDGMRDGKTRQGVYYFNPAVIR